jgi:hypothetical protein
MFGQIDQIWFFIFAGVIFVCFVFFLINVVRDRVRRNAAIRLGLECIRLIYDVDDGVQVRVSYFKVGYFKLLNIARVPLGTYLTKETFEMGEGLAGLLWDRYVLQSNENFTRVNNLPSAKENYLELIEKLQNAGVKLDPKKVLRFKDDIKSYLILAMSHPNSGRFLGVVSLDSTVGSTFESNDDLAYVRLVVDKIAKSLYDKGVWRRRKRSQGVADAR